MCMQYKVHLGLLAEHQNTVKNESSLNRLRYDQIMFGLFLSL